jgi:hypothetical protein
MSCLKYSKSITFRASLLLIISVLTINSFGQNGFASDAPKVFIDCQTQCYEEHIRSQLSYLNFMHDRQTADVYLLLTALRTGSGGREWNLLVKGQDRFEGMNDTLKFYSIVDASDGQIQDMQVEQIQFAIHPQNINC